MTPFAKYIQIADTEQRMSPDSRTYRKHWSNDQLADGIIQAAMNALAVLLAPEFPPDIQELMQDIFSFSRSAIYRDCRIHVVGTSVTGPIPARLCAEVEDKAREAITLCLLPGLGMEFVTHRIPISLDVRTGVIPLYPSDIDALAIGRLTLDQLIEYKLFRRFLAERPDAETQYIERIFREYGCEKSHLSKLVYDLDRALEIRGEAESEWLEHPYLPQVDAQVSKRRHSLLFGYSSSGKSVLAFQVGRRRATAGWRVGYLNLSDDMSWPGGLIQELLFRPNGNGIGWEFQATAQEVIIVDDLQSRPAVARLLLAIASLSHRVRERSRPVLLGVSWKEFASEAAEYCPEVFPVAVHAYQVRDRLLEKYSTRIASNMIAAISSEAGDDLYLLRLALEVTARHKNLATRDEVAEDVWKQRVPGSNKPLMPEAARRVALLTGAIGQFDIHVPPGFLQQTAHVEPRVISQLMESHLLRRVGNSVTLGHRSLCALIAWWLGKNGAWEELAEVGGPRDIASAVFAYLAASGTTATIDAIRALVARAGFKRKEALSQRAATIVDIWRAFDAVVEKVEHQQASDHTWGNTPSSAMFVTTLLAEIGKPELAVPSLMFLRDHWKEVDGHLEINLSGLSTVVDFDIIRQKILDQDDKPCKGANIESALELDINRFHKTWLSGFFLGAEAVAEPPQMPRDRLSTLVEREQISTSGAFYPQRVPWCTARVVLGLAACGRTIETDLAVKRAVEWLLRDRSAGGASSNGIWYPCTGGWNTPIETTALVLLAVVRSGLDPSDPRLVEGRRYLLSQRHNWAGFEGAAAIEALLVSGSKWEDLAIDTAQLSQKALDQSLWLRATLPANEIFQQTCHVAQAATHLIGIGWMAIQADLRELLEALDLPTESSDEAQIGSALSTPIERPQEALRAVRLIVDEIADRVQAFIDLPLRRYTVVGNYVQFNEQVRNELRDRYTAIRKALEVKSTNRDNFLIWGPPGNGKTYFVKEIARAIGEGFFRDRFISLNLSELSREDFLLKLSKVEEHGPGALLCMIDEIDGRSSETWPYESVYSCLDWNTKNDKHVVFILLGSGGRGLNGIISAIRERPRGADLIDRIPEANRFEVPDVDTENRLVVFAKQVLLAAGPRKQVVNEIERLALYYILKSETLLTPRQLTELAKASVARMDISDGRLRYDHLFPLGDKQRMEFWAKYVESSARLQGTFMWITD